MARARHSGHQGDVTWNGKRYRASGFATSVAAQIWENQCLANVMAGKLPPPSPSTGEGATWTLGQMLDWAYDVHWSKNSADPRFAAKLIKLLKKDIGPDYPAADMAGPAGYAKLKEACVARGNAGRTINHKASIVSKALKLAVDEGKLDVSKPQYPHQPQTAGRQRILSREEERACLAWLQQFDPEMGKWFVLGIDTGFRSYSEGLNIYPFQDVHPAPGRTGMDLFIRGRIVSQGESSSPNVVDFAAATRRVKTGENKSRVVGLTDRAWRIIEAERRTLHNRRDARLFENLTERTIHLRWDLMKQHLQITDPGFVPYALRHTFGTRMILAGETVPNVSVLMGHSSIKQTWKYVHLAGLVQGDAVNRLEKYLEKEGR